MKKVNVTLCGSRNNRKTLKAKVWLDLQKVPYSFIDLFDIKLAQEERLPNDINPDLVLNLCARKSSVDLNDFFPEKSITFSKLLSTFENNPILKCEPMLVYPMDSSQVALYSSEVVIGFNANKYLNLIDELYNKSHI